MSVFPNLIVYDEQLIREQWKNLSDLPHKNYMDIHKIKVSDFWFFINNFEDKETEEYIFAELSSICLVDSAYPHANGTTERKFSDVKNAKTDKRNYLKIETLNGIMRSRDVIAANQKDGVFDPPESLVDYYFDRKKEKTKNKMNDSLTNKIEDV